VKQQQQQKEGRKGRSRRRKRRRRIKSKMKIKKWNGHRTSTAMHVTCRNSSKYESLFPPGICSSAAGLYHSLFHAALHGTSVHFCHAELLFSCPNAVPLYRPLLKNELTEAMKLVYKMLSIPLHIPPPYNNIFTNTCSQTDICHFPYYHILAKKKIVPTVTPRDGLGDNPICRKCGTDEETSVHILCKCEAWPHLRYTHLASFFLDPEDIRELGIGAI
jgi:hypothetical protein